LVESPIDHVDVIRTCDEVWMKTRAISNDRPAYKVRCYHAISGDWVLEQSGGRVKILLAGREGLTSFLLLEWYTVNIFAFRV